ncbi:MAG TPA: poly-gamma-glutamate system protein [Bacteroidales bacterium]|nr:poly-gamma-glutamate system protein [Bacteroidales bacterium]
MNIKLLIAFVVLLIATTISVSLFRKQLPLAYGKEMAESVELTKRMFKVIKQLKLDRNIESDALSNVPYSFMIGDEWSEITTTLGSLEAKEISTNPDFSALIVRLLHEANITEGDKVGIILSGSFPSLAISVLAALQTMEIESVVMSSPGASTFGANQPGATWTDMESALKKQGLHFNTVLVSIGAGDDSGAELSDEGLAIIRNTAYRNKVDLYIPPTLLESINKRVEIFKAANISLLINIGGNETALGNCNHSLSIPNGLHSKLSVCTDENRGLIARMNESGIPFINMLDLKDLASMYGIDVSPGTNYSESTGLYNTIITNKTVLGIILIISLIPILLLRKRA